MSGRCWKPVLIGCAAWLLAACAMAADPPQIAHLEDPGGALSIDDVRSASARARFVPAQAAVLNFGLSGSAFWIRVTLPPGPAEALLLEVATPYLDFIEFHPPPGSGEPAIQTGDRRPFHSRPIDYRHPVFVLHPAPGEARAYHLRVRNSGAVQVPLRFAAPAHFEREVRGEQFWFGAYYGLLGVMVLYNLFLLVGVRDDAYRWYVVYVALFGLFVFARNGFAYQWLWPDSPWLGNNAHYLLIAVAVAAAAQFSRRFLATARQAPRMDLALRLTAGFGLAVIAAALAGEQRIAVLLVQLHSLAAVALGLAAAALARHRGFRPANYYLLAFAALMLSGLFSVARNLGLYPADVLATYGVQIGSAVEIVLLALGLADRINVLKRERAEAQTAALEAARRAERELEARVAERTEELAKANALLREREAQLLHLAHHDTLTTLANRRLLVDRLGAALARCRRHGGSLAVLLIDLDRFKQVNDVHGHDAGDEVLRVTAERMLACLRASDTAARLGGDEFVALIEGPGEAGQWQPVADKLCALLSQPIAFAGAILTVTPSIGVALFPEDADDADALLVRADEAMYEVKRRGRAGVFRNGAAERA